MAHNNYDEIFEEVLKISIIDVFEHYGFHPKRCGVNHQLPSPFRDGSKTSFTLNERMGIFKDWVDSSLVGNSIKFVSLYFNMTYFQACMKIAYDFGIISEDDFKKAYSKKISTVAIKKYESIGAKKIENVIAPPEVLDEVLRIFISFTTLSDAHLEHLKNVRNLDEETIKNHMFFTFPTRAILRKFLKEIEAVFGSQDILKDVPGFFKRKSEKNFTFKTFKGIGIPIFNEMGQIIGIQIRLDESKTGNRYFWFSSGNIADDEEFGTSSGSPIDVVYPKELKYKGIFITEGKFKALKLAETYKCVVLSVQGVSTWKPIIPLLSRITEAINLNYAFGGDWKIQMIYSAFDADLCENYGVYKQLKNMTDEILANVEDSVRGAKFNVRYLYWDVNIGKGIDDLINVSTADELAKRLSLQEKAKFDEAYMNMINKIIDDKDYSSDSEILSKLSQEEFMEYFNNYFILS